MPLIGPGIWIGMRKAMLMLLQQYHTRSGDELIDSEGGDPVQLWLPSSKFDGTVNMGMEGTMPEAIGTSDFYIEAVVRVDELTSDYRNIFSTSGEGNNANSFRITVNHNNNSVYVWHNSTSAYMTGTVSEGEILKIKAAKVGNDLLFYKNGTYVNTISGYFSSSNITDTTYRVARQYATGVSGRVMNGLISDIILNKAGTDILDIPLPHTGKDVLNKVTGTILGGTYELIIGGTLHLLDYGLVIKDVTELWKPNNLDGTNDFVSGDTLIEGSTFLNDSEWAVEFP